MDTGSQRQGIGGTGIHPHLAAFHFQHQHTVKHVLLQGNHFHPFQPDVEMGENIPHQVVGLWAGDFNLLEGDGNRLRLKWTNPDGQVAFLVHLAQDDNPLLVGQIHAYAVNHHFNHCQIPPQAFVAA